MQTTPKRNSRRTARGFTLLELLVVCTIIVLMAGVVTVSISPSLEEARLRASTLKVMAALRYARSYAVTHQTDAEVRFDTERNGIAVYAFEQNDDGEEADWQAVTTQAGRFRALSPEVSVASIKSDVQADEDANSGEQAVTFSLLGRCSDDVSIVLQDKKEQQRIILVDALTGRCEIAETEQQ